MSKGTKSVHLIIGRMADEVKVRTTQGGKKIGSVRLAVASGYGEHEVTSWLDVVVFDEKKVDVLERFTGKGSKICVVGEVRVRKWTKDGVDHWATETIVGFDGTIELLDSKAESKATDKRNEPASKPMSAFDTDLDDDVPF